MKQAVWKFEIYGQDITDIKLPVGAKPLSVQEQHGKIQLWCLCNLDEKTLERRFFRLAGTGETLCEDGLEFIDTFQLMGGNLVYHLFEIKD